MTGDRYGRREYFCVYTRVSTKGQDDNTSDEQQYRAAREFGESQGWTYLEGAWIHDTHTGAEFKKRKNVNKVIELLEQGKVKYVVWKKVDRAARDQVVLRQFIEEIYDAKGKIAIVDKGMMYPTKRKAIEGTAIDGFFSQWEKNTIAGRFDDGKLEQFIRGSNVYALPFGYVSNPTTKDGKKFKEVLVDESQKDSIVSFLGEFVRTRNQGKAVAYAREQGFKTGTGQPFNHDTLRYLLEKLDIYAGLPQKQWYNKEREHHRVFTYPRIISDDLYKAVKEAAQLKTRSKATVDKPFAELVYCAHCGSAAKVFPWQTRAKKDGTRPLTFVYGCKKYNRVKRADYINTGKHLHTECRRTVVFNFIKEVVTEFLDSAATYASADKYSEELTQIILGTRDLYTNLQALKESRKGVIAEIDKISKRIDKAFDLDDSDTLQATIRRFQDQIEEHQQKLDGINLEIEDKAAQYEKVSAVLSDMGVTVNDSLFGVFDAKEAAFGHFKIGERLEAANLGITRDDVVTLRGNLFIPDVVRRQTDQMKANISALRAEIGAENWKEVNSLMYRLGLRVYVNFNDISTKGGRDKPRAEVKATLEGLGVTGFFETPYGEDSRT
ncbi:MULTISPECIES: recombinase family protein [Deinococcus]|uniref:Recombinase family protein n=1 Tax=Deinococcus rufus TaxID=2136097 RepID=A0ABV7Z718_9DEIO|nr:recombinase family protein [Deinococcus sp. AB2017081]WQE94443.1 recombinase family protein [Deinococcus sp. AB2017081]